jgi:hypothetical protein
MVNKPTTDSELIEYVAEILEELYKLVRPSNERFLVFLVEMAYSEADRLRHLRHSVRKKNGAT